MDPIGLATERVDNDPQLSQYRDLLIEYDWPNEDEHLQWVATAPTTELINWAETIRRDEANS